MGIRNLAYCIFDVPKSSSKTLPSIRAWRRLAVSTAPEVAAQEPDGAVLLPAKESFNPATLSAVAYTLLRKKLLLEGPTHILIERQRFRSMGSRNILEWTVRVNMFESILYAVLCTLKGEGVWKGEIQAIAPGKVGPFWVGEETGDGEGSRKERKSKSAKVRNKGVKIDLVRGWLEGGELVGLGNEEVEGVARRYKEKWDRTPGGRRKGDVEGKEKMGKLDDLADCLLQGMAWIQWEENKRTALKHGVEALLES
jgi:cruciform cutting endonuclease 1